MVWEDIEIYWVRWIMEHCGTVSWSQAWKWTTPWDHALLAGGDLPCSWWPWPREVGKHFAYGPIFALALWCFPLFSAVLLQGSPPSDPGHFGHFGHCGHCGHCGHLQSNTTIAAPLRLLSPATLYASSNSSCMRGIPPEGSLPWHVSRGKPREAMGFWSWRQKLPGTESTCGYKKMLWI